MEPGKDCPVWNWIIMLNIPKEMAPNTMIHANEYYYNDGYYFSNCNTSMPNSECHYLEKGCTGCLNDKAKFIANTFKRAVNNIQIDNITNIHNYRK